MEPIVAEDRFVKVNNINLHYIAYANEGSPTLLLLHGLTANAHAFDGLVASGLNKSFQLIMPDLRGRGLSDHPAFHYSVEDHIKDILGLMDSLGLDSVILGGHSFGGLLAYYMAANYPKRVKQLVILDAAAEMNPNTFEMLGSSLSRLAVVYPSLDDYLAAMKAAPFNSKWDDAMLSYHMADVKELVDGTIRPRASLANIMEISYNVGNISWPYYVSRVQQATLLINAVEDYTMGAPLLPEGKAMDTVAMMHDARYVQVDGNHHTMLYGRGAKEIVDAIDKFIAGA